MGVKRIVGVSDVRVGYGSPQVPVFMRSLRHQYGEAEVTLLEPDPPEKAAAHNLLPDLDIMSIPTAFHPHSAEGRIEYLLQATSAVDRLRPDVLVCFVTYTLPVLFKLRRRLPFVIYYALELASAYGPFDVEMNRRLGRLVDLIIYPEENRAALDIQTSGYKDIPFAILFNCTNPLPAADGGIVAPELRNGRILYAGTIQEGRTCAEHFLHRTAQHFPIDMYGFVTGGNRDDLEERLRKLSGQVRYMGHVDSKMLGGLRKNYSFSVVAWNPVNDQHYFACPNKFFESIADGVPPIAAPHPQCKMLIERYGCGILMEDWTYGSFVRAVEGALKMRVTPRYKEMVESCRRATTLELNWDTQFSKVKPFLPG